MAEPAATRRRSAKQRRPGMDHAHHAFRTLTEAPRFAWPDDARIAFTVTLVLDYWELNPPQDANPRPAHRFAAGQLLPRLADLEPARIRRARRHLPRAGRAGPVRRDAQRGARRGGGEALSGAGGRADAAQRLLPGARQLRDASHHQPHERGRGTRVHRREPRCGARGDRRGAARLVRPGLQRIRRARRRCWPRPASPTPPTGRATTGRSCWTVDGHLVALPPQPEWNDLECMWLRRVPPPVWADNIAEAFAVPARRGRRVVQPDAASVDRRPGAPHPLAARGAVPRARARADLAHHHRRGGARGARAAIRSPVIASSPSTLP